MTDSARIPVFAVFSAALFCSAIATGCASPTHAVAPAPTTASTGVATAPGTVAQQLSLLKDKFRFTLPAAYVGRDLVARSGTPDDNRPWGVMYVSDENRQIVVVSEAPNPAGTQVGDRDNIFLTGAGTGYNRQQQRAHPHYIIKSERTIEVNGLGMRRIEATDIIDGGNALSTALLAASGPTLAVVQVISGANDQASHAALVERILSGR